MNPMDKKLIIDKIFGFYILNEMRDVLKEESKNIKSYIDRISGEIYAISRSITSSQKELEELEKRIVENKEDEIEKIKKELEKYKTLLEYHNDKLKAFKDKEIEIQNNIVKSHENYIISSNKLKEIKERISLYNNDKCPYCLSDLSTEFHKVLLENLIKQKEDFESQNLELKKDYERLKTIQNDFLTLKNEILIKGEKIEFSIRNLKEKIKNLENNKNDEQLNSIKKILSITNDELLKYNREKIIYEEKQSWIKTLDEVLSERGVKQLAIKSILPSLNKEIHNNLLLLHLPYKVIFNEEFDAKIFHLNEEISIQTLSTGEMKKIDFVVLISIIKLMKIRFPSINLLFLDEIFSSIDSDGIYTILKVLRKLCDDLKMNIFVINHAPMPNEIFDYKIEISKKNNFSDLYFEKLN